MWRPTVALVSPLAWFTSSALTQGPGGLGMREALMIYLGGVILLLVVCTTIDRKEKVGFDHILIAAFGWPIFTSILALKAFGSR